MTQKTLIEKLDYPNVVEETFNDLSSIKESVLKLIGSILNENKKENVDVSILMQTIVQGTIENTQGLINYEVLIHMLSAAFMNGFAQGALAAHKVLEVEELERLGEL